MSLNKRQSKDRVEFSFKVLALLADLLRKGKVLPISKLRTAAKRFNRNQTKQYLRENPSIRDLIYDTVSEHTTLRSQTEAVEAIRQNPQIMEKLFEPAPSPTPSVAPAPSVTPGPSPTPTELSMDDANRIATRLTGQPIPPKISTKKPEERLREYLQSQGYNKQQIDFFISQDEPPVPISAVPIPVPLPPVVEEPAPTAPTAPTALKPGKKRKKKPGKKPEQKEKIDGPTQDEDELAFSIANEIARVNTGKEIPDTNRDKPIRVRLDNHLRGYGYTTKQIRQLKNEYLQAESTQSIYRSVIKKLMREEPELFEPPRLALEQQSLPLNTSMPDPLEEDIGSNTGPAISRTIQTPASRVPIPAPERVQTRPSAPLTTVSGDVQRDIIESSREGKHTPQSRSLQTSSVSGVVGLGLRADQIRRVTQGLNEGERRIANELLGQREINFNNLFDAIGTAALITIIGNMVTGGQASVFAPIIASAITQLRDVLGINFDRYFTVRGNQLQVRTNELVNLEGNLDRIINNANIDQFASIRTQIIDSINRGRLRPTALDNFDRITTRRYFLDTRSLDREEEVESAESRNLNQFLGREAEILQNFQDMFLSREGQGDFRRFDAQIDQLNRAFNEAPMSVPSAITQYQNPFIVPYYEQVNNILDNPGSAPEYFEMVVRGAIRSEVNAQDVSDILFTLQTNLNDMSRILNREFELIESPTAGQIEEERERLQAVSRQESARSVRSQAVMGGIAGGTAAGAAAAMAGTTGSGAGLAETIRAIGLGAMKGGVAGGTTGLGLELLGVTETALPAIIAGVSQGVQQGLSTNPIIPPPDTLQVIQQDNESKKGTLRPKFIVPSTSILDKSESEVQGDFDEYAMFDFVIPGNEGGEGTNENNPLKRANYISEQLMLKGGGIDQDVPLGQLDLPTQQTIREVKLGPELPEMEFENSVYNLSEFEVVPYDPNDDRLQIEGLNPYRYYSNAYPLDIQRSVLFGEVP